MSQLCVVYEKPPLPAAPRHMPSTKTHKTVGDTKANRTSPTNEPDDPPTSQRLQLFWVWLAVGSAVAAMTAVGWYLAVKLEGVAPGGDLVGHAAAAEWLNTLPWWDWRGWSDWFYGGQAIGVSYPPLGHAWMRFTHPVYGQLFAVTVGLVLLLPWGALRLERAVDLNPRAQRAAVASVLVLTAASGNMHWVLSGFHYRNTLFGSWPAMLARLLDCSLPASRRVANVPLSLVCSPVWRCCSTPQ